jgi:hypothetical protein
MNIPNYLWIKNIDSLSHIITLEKTPKISNENQLQMELVRVWKSNQIWTLPKKRFMFGFYTGFLKTI